ncbi:MAG: ribosomal-protein-alanine N-acetyltransferase [Ruminococcaceae bacterium]|nr:ribosomal-protein-alanine N-acetyltransferase [Oscillospiraceae bacterium]
MVRLQMIITFICTGNTCRSPLAEGLFKKINPEYEVYSAGLCAVFGQEVSENSVIAALDYGVDISSHVSRPLSKELLAATDLFVCLSHSHAMQLIPLVGRYRVYVLGNGISDPYGGNLEVYKKCAKEIYDGLVKLNEDLKTMPLIRFMEEKDIDGVAEVEKECFANPWSEQSLKEELENGNARFFVCETKGEIAGYIGTISVFGECSVTNVAVKEKFRNKGIARALLERAILNSTLADDEFITLEVRKSNIPAISLYEKYGFVKMGERKNFYRSPTEDAFIYNKYLKGENK